MTCVLRSTGGARADFTKLAEHLTTSKAINQRPLPQGDNG